VLDLEVGSARVMTTWADIENRRLSGLTWREHAWVARQRRGPAIYLRWLAYEWRRWTALPGDVFWDYTRDVYIVVHSGRPGNLMGYRISGHFAAYARGVLGIGNRYALDFTEVVALAIRDPRCDVALERVTLP
jgi:hypothetical protein